MALDGVFLLAVKQELEPLVGGRIEKIHQPSRDEIVISVRLKEGSRRLLLSFSSGSARVHITSQSIENPKVPPMFCMLLRKRLGCGKLLAVRQDGLERILYLDWETVNELGDVVTVTLAAELMGKYSNLIIIDQNGKIIDCLKHIGDAASSERPLLPGMTYRTPERSDRLNFLIASDESMTQRISGMTGSNPAKCIVSEFEGISPVLAREWIFCAAGGRDITTEDIDDDMSGRIVSEIKRTRDDFLSGRRKYIILKETNGSLRDFCFADITQYGRLMETLTCKSACSLLDCFYSERDNAARMKQRYQDLFRLLSSTHDRIARRTANQRRELEISEERASLKLCGDLIAANMYRIEKGMNSLECENIYDENSSMVTVKLDPRLTPSQNMQKYYQGYRKADTAEKQLKRLIAAGEDELQYIESVSDALSRAQTESDVAQLRLELCEQGYIRSPKSKSKPPRPAPPIEFTSPDGYMVLVGRNNAQNDRLTLKMAEKTDIWLHAKNITGSHVIIRTGGTEVPESTVRFAAEIAAFHSSAASSSQVPVDYVPVKYVKKPSGAKPGMVIFTNNRTLYVTPKAP